MGLRHVVQPNTFTLQLPHKQAYSMGEASLTNFLSVSAVRLRPKAAGGAVCLRCERVTWMASEYAWAPAELHPPVGFDWAKGFLCVCLQMEPVFRQLVEELGGGVYVPVTTFGDSCSLNMPAAEVY
jgi:hypothetical protein